MIYEKKCPVCGKKFSTVRKNQVCCGVSCAASYKRTQHVDRDFIWQKENDGKYACRYNPQGCSCSNRRCLDCGWNPEVAKERLDEIRQKMQEVPV